MIERYSTSCLYKILNEIQFVKNIYDQNHLPYHNMNHIMDCIYNFNNFLYINLNDKSKIYNFLLAILYHDIVYRPGESDNEELSCQFFEKNNKDLDKQDIEYVKKIIMSTKIPKSYNPNLSVEEKIMHDVDYSGFGLEYTKYLENSVKILSEYAHIAPLDVLRKQRYEFLNHTNNQRIFYFKFGLENIAHENISKEMELLKSGDFPITLNTGILGSAL